jgi:hypothetical protein
MAESAIYQKKKAISELPVFLFAEVQFFQN